MEWNSPNPSFRPCEWTLRQMNGLLIAVTFWQRSKADMILAAVDGACVPGNSAASHSITCAQTRAPTDQQAAPSAVVPITRLLQTNGPNLSPTPALSIV